MLSFPDIAMPNISSATNCQDSYKEKIADSVISTTTDANYKQTRPRTTKMIGSWSFSWVGLSEKDYTILKTFFKTVGRFTPFTWINPIDNQEYTVRITSEWSWQEVFPIGWQGSIAFEEV